MKLMKCGRLKRGLAVASLLALALTGAAGQIPPGAVTKEEAAEARASATAFAERLHATQDFAAVARELYAEDFMERQLKGLSDWSERVRVDTFMLAGIPSLTFERSLAAKADAADWKRLRLAADNVVHFMWLSYLSGRSFEDLGDPEQFDESDVLRAFTPAAVAVLNTHPALANFVKKQESEVIIRTPEELRAVASGLEEAGRLMRPRLAETTAKSKHLDANLRLFRQSLPREEVLTADAKAAGYPEGTRLFKVFAPNVYSLLLVRQGGVLKIVWAGLPSD